MNSESKVAVIGAGMAGLSCARALAAQGIETVVFDKGRGLGGRMATRRAQGDFQFDHGAQYITARTPEFTATLQQVEQAGALARWPRHRETPAYVGVPGMTGFAKHLAEGLDVRRETRIERVVETANAYRLEGDGFTEDFHRVVCTVPAPQLSALLPQGHAFAAAVDTVKMVPNLTLMVGLSSGVQMPFVTRRDPQDDLSWIACDSDKPARPGAVCVVAQAGRAFSMRYLELDRDEIAAQMMRLLADAIGADALSDPSYVAAHRWRYAFVSAPLGQPYLVNSARTLFAGGDWCLGAKVEDAWTSGRAIAAAVIDGI